MAHDLKRILELAVEHGASDVVLTAGASIAYKINGRWAQVNADPLTGEQAKALVDAVLTPAQTARLDREREIVFALEFEAPAAAAPKAKEGEAAPADAAAAKPADAAERRRFRYRGAAYFQRG